MLLVCYLLWMLGHIYVSSVPPTLEKACTRKRTKAVPVRDFAEVLKVQHGPGRGFERLPGSSQHDPLVFTQTDLHVLSPARGPQGSPQAQGKRKVTFAEPTTDGS